MANMHAEKAMYAFDCLSDFDFRAARDTLSGILDFYGTDVMPIGPALHTRYRAKSMHPGRHSAFVTLILDAYLMLDRLIESDTEDRLQDRLITLRTGTPEALEAALAETPIQGIAECVAYAVEVLIGREV